jgi:pimeloyl-ACP methyl ester carboxylesterase
VQAKIDLKKYGVRVYTGFIWQLHCDVFLYRTVAVDMRGYGDSDKPAGLEDYKMCHLVNDIKEIIEALGTYILNSA